MTVADNIRELISATEKVIENDQLNKNEIRDLRDAIRREDRSVYETMEDAENKMDEVDDFDLEYAEDAVDVSLKQTYIHDRLNLASDILGDNAEVSTDNLNRVKGLLEDALETAEML